MSPATPIPAAGDSQSSIQAAVESAGPGGHVAVALSGSEAGQVRLRMAIAGLVDISAGGGKALVGSVPDHAVGAAAPLKAGGSLWASAAADGEELVDEDELLARDGVPDGPSAGAGAGCAVDENGKRKPCKDCSCGLADMDGNEKEVKKEPGKGCGSCALGDAFRCAGCPYLGLPPFKPGERVELPSSLMTSDI